MGAFDDQTAINLYGTNRVEVALSIARTNSATVELFDAERVLRWRAP
jgi:hypothetical protein